MTFFIVYYNYVQNNFKNTPYIIFKWVQSLNPKPAPNRKPYTSSKPKTLHWFQTLNSKLVPNLKLYTSTRP
jgi:hypothetical protein